MDTIRQGKPLYFVSDLHLGTGTRGEEAVKQERFSGLLREAQENAHGLYIVGDLFDFWFEYKHVLPRGYHRVLTGLEDVRRRGIEVVYLRGNHDFAAGKFFEDELDIRVVADEYTFDYDGKRFYLYHGDGLALKDGGYRILKRVLRSPVSGFFFRWLHPDIGFRIAHGSSHTSRAYTSNKKYGSRDGMLLEAERRIGEGADYVIMGHRHNPVQQAMGNGTYVNLGDWVTHCTFGMYENGEFSLYELQDGGVKRKVEKKQ